MTDATSGGLPAARPRKILTQIAPVAWEHPADRAALQSLRSVPGFDEVLKKIYGFLGRARACACCSRPTPSASGRRSSPGCNQLYTDVVHHARLVGAPRAVRLADAVRERRRLRDGQAVHRDQLRGADPARRRRDALAARPRAGARDERPRAVPHDARPAPERQLLARCPSSRASPSCRSSSRCSSGSARASCRRTAPACSPARTRWRRCGCSSSSRAAAT